MNPTYNILVTGCGGDIGQSIGKILKSSTLFSKVIGCDMTDEHASIFIYDEVIKVPACKSPNYLTSLEAIIKKELIDIVLPISEHELRLLSEQSIEHTFLNKVLICANLKSMQIGFDKYATAIFLQKASLPFPETNVIGDVTEPILPLILKSRTGAGSKSVFVLNRKDEFEFYKKKYPDFIVQELLENADEEYTSGVFKSLGGDIRTITYKRKLVDSYSGFGVVVENEAIDNLLVKIANGLNLRGSINVQLRLAAKGPCVFEINPRFSSTVMFRHLMGFEDIIWSIQDALSLPVASYSKPLVGTKFYKGFTEYVN